MSKPKQITLEVAKALKLRLMARVEKRSNGCWVWMGTLDGKGYGQMCHTRATRFRCHRLSWLLYKGEIPSGLWVLHRCDNRACVRPKHLFLGTAMDNSKDMVGKGRSAWGDRSAHAKLTPEQIKEVFDLNRTMTQAKIAAKVGVKESNISAILRGTSWKNLRSRERPHVLHHTNGEVHHSAKLTAVKVRRILRMLKAGCTLTAIAIEFGVTIQSIAHIRNGRNWKHIPRP